MAGRQAAELGTLGRAVASTSTRPKIIVQGLRWHGRSTHLDAAAGSQIVAASSTKAGNTSTERQEIPCSARRGAIAETAASCSALVRRRHQDAWTRRSDAEIRDSVKQRGRSGGFGEVWSYCRAEDAHDGPTSRHHLPPIVGGQTSRTPSWKGPIGLVPSKGT